MTLRDRLRVDDLAEGAGMILLLFGFAVLIGLAVGFTAQRWATDPGRPISLYRSSGAPKEVVDQGYKSESDFNADHAREQETISRLLVAPVGTQVLWENPETGNRGVIWVASEHVGNQGAQNGQTCRDLVRHTLLNNTYRNTVGTTCHTAGKAFAADIAWQVE